MHMFHMCNVDVPSDWLVPNFSFLLNIESDISQALSTFNTALDGILNIDSVTFITFVPVQSHTWYQYWHRPIPPTELEIQ